MVQTHMNFRHYDHERDQKAVHRIFYEIGWFKKKEHEAAFDVFVQGCRALVAEINGAAECFVASAPGTIRYLDEDLKFGAITAVTTSRIARKQGLAKRLTAQLIAADVADGALVSGLGMFEQGFYNRLGFGTGGYEHWIGFDPAHLKVKKRARVPRRITKDDWQQAHAAMLARRRGHGGCNLLPPELIRGEMLWADNGFGLGYFDGPDGDLTHFVWCSANGEHGPYTVDMRAYQNWDQFLELMALLKNLEDQVRLVRMREPGGIQLQDLIEYPFRQRQVTEKSEFASVNRASAYWQLRICDLPGCLAQTHLRGGEVRFNLKLSDPIEAYLDADAAWRGVAGDYVITFGPASGAEPGRDPSLPTLTASVGAFTRMWLGVRPASGLAVTDELAGPPELLEALDWALRLPQPKPDWDF